MIFFWKNSNNTNSTYIDLNDKLNKNANKELEVLYPNTFTNCTFFTDCKTLKINSPELIDIRESKSIENQTFWQIHSVTI